MAEVKQRSLVRRVVAVVVLGLAGALGALAAAAGSASAVGPPCTVTWAGPVNGFWSDASRWSTGVVPGELDDVCINQAGTYGVSLSGQVSVRSLDVGGPTGDQRLTVVGAAGGSRLALAAASTIRPQATLELSSGAAGTAWLQPAAPIVNHGTVSFQSPGAPSTLLGALTNATDGHIQVGQSSTTWFWSDVVNDGTLTVAPGASLTHSGGSFASKAGSTISVGGPFDAYAVTFMQVGGLVTGGPVTLGSGSTLADSAGAGEFVLLGPAPWGNSPGLTLTGTIPAGQTVRILAREPQSTTVDVPGPVRNEGTLLLDVADSSAANISGAGTLTNQGTIRTLGVGGFKIFDLDLTNSPGATVEVAGRVTVFGGTTTNNGAITVTSTGMLFVDGGTFVSNLGSSLDLGGWAGVRSGTFTQAGGSVTGEAVLLSDGSTLDDSAGPGAFVLLSGTAPSVVRGNIPSGQTVSVRGTPGGDAVANLAGPSVVNNGTLALDTGGGSGGATLGGSPLTNNGTLVVRPGGSHRLRMPITNAGTIDFAATTSVENGVAIVNDGLVKLGRDVDVAFIGGSFTNSASGTLGLTIDGAAADPGLGPSILGGSNTLSLAGTLDVTTIGVPAVGTTYTPIFGTTRTGAFSQVTSSSVAFTASYTPTSVVLTTSSPGARFVPTSPTRILDTRTGNGRPAGRVGAGGVVDLAVGGRGGVPATGASAVVLTVTGVDSSPGFVTVWPSGTVRPTTSNLNTSRAGQTTAVQVVIPVGSDGHVQLFSSGGGHLLADVAGWYEPVVSATSGRFRAVAPVRLLDTRNGTGAPAGRRSAGSSVTLPTAGLGGVPASGASAVVLSVTGVDSSPGYVTVWPAGSSRPTASNLNTDFAGQTVAAHVVVPVGAGGSVSLFTSGGGHLLVDVVGWFTDGTAASSTSGLYVALSPERRLDTRIGLGVTATGVRPAHSTTGLALGGSNGIPSTGVAAVVANVTAVQSSPTFLTAWAGGGPRPLASNLNVTVPGDTVANLVTSPVGGGASLNLYTDGATHLLLDTFGYYLS